MSDLNWRKVAFKEICTSLLNGGTPNTNTNKYWNGNIPWVTGADFANQALSQVRRRITAAAVQQSTTKMVKAGSILLVTRTGVGKIAIAPYDVAFSQDITGINFGDSVDVRFMYYCLQAHMEEFKKLNQGTSINGILKEDFLAYQINLPPLPQQRKIAKILTTVDNLIEKTESLIAKYQSVKQGMMHDLFTRGVDAKGKLRPPQSDAPELYKQSELGWIPKDWEVMRLGEVAEKISDGEHLSPIFVEFGVALVSAKDVRSEILDFSEVRYISAEAARKSWKRCDPRPQDILIVSRGATIGRIHRVRTTKSFALMGSVIQIRPSIKIDSSFIESYLQHPSSQDELLRTSGSSAQQAIYLAHIKRMFVPCPSSIEQKIIGSRIVILDHQIGMEVQSANKMRELKTALMQDLLTGKVQVSPDAEDKELAHA